MRLAYNRRPSVAIAATLVCIGGLACCSSGAPTTQPEATTTASTLAQTPTSASQTSSISLNPQARATQDITAALARMNSVYLGASKAADPDDPALPTVFGGELLKSSLSALTSLKDQKITLSGDAVFGEPKVTEVTLSVSPPTATVEQCIDDTKLVQTKSGTILQAPKAPVPATYTAHQVDGSWIFIKKLTGDRGSGVCGS